MRKVSGVLDRVRTDKSEPAGKLAAEKVCRTMSDACPGTVRMAIRCLEELDLAKAVVARALFSELGGGRAPDRDRPLERTVAVTPQRLLDYGAVHEACRYVDDADDFLRRQVTALRDVTFLAGAGPDDMAARADKVALFNIVEVREWRDTEEEPAAVHWMVRGGLWAGSHLRRPCRDALCRIARASLEPKRESAASLVLRIGSLAMSDACPNGKRIHMAVSVEYLLAAVGRLPAPQLRTGAWVRRTADDLQVASRALHGVGFFRRADTPAWSPDADSDAIDRWLQAESTFALGPGIR